jgi:hypothetical protein
MAAGQVILGFTALPPSRINSIRSLATSNYGS